MCKSRGAYPYYINVILVSMIILYWITGTLNCIRIIKRVFIFCSEFTCTSSLFNQKNQNMVDFVWEFMSNNYEDTSRNRWCFCRNLLFVSCDTSALSIPMSLCLATFKKDLNISGFCHSQHHSWYGVFFIIYVYYYHQSLCLFCGNCLWHWRHFALCFWNLFDDLWFS